MLSSSQFLLPGDQTLTLLVPDMDLTPLLLINLPLLFNSSELSWTNE